MARFIAVMGVGRCGSSAVAGMLHEGGVPMGQDLIGPHERFNARGHYEEHEWHWLNRLVAHQLADRPEIRNETIQRYPQFEQEPPWTDADLFRRYREAVTRHSQSPVWGMKCIMLGYIWPYVGHLFGDDVRIISVVRDREAVIRSRMEHSQLEREQAEALIDALQEGISRTLQDTTWPILHLRYEDVIRSPTEAAQALSLFVDAPGFDTAAAEQHIDPALNHHGAAVCA